MELKYVLSLLLIIAAIIMLTIVYVSFRKRNNDLALSCSFLMLATSVYSLGYAFEILCKNVDQMKVCLRIEYLGIPVITPLWLILVLRYVGYKMYISKKNLLIFLIPMITLILHYTNDFHHLFYKDIKIQETAYFTVSQLTKGPWYWVHISYSYGIIIIGLTIYIATYLKAQSLMRKQIVLMVIGSFLPWMLNILYLINRDGSILDLTPFGFVATGIIYMIAIFKLNLLKFRTIALEYVFNAMEDGIIILDTHEDIINFNDAAKGVIKELNSFDISKRQAEGLLKSYPCILDKLHEDKCYDDLCIIKEKAEVFYKVKVLPIKFRREVLGKILVISNITEQKMLMKKLSELADIDELTQIYNRRYFFRECNKEIERARRYKTVSSVIIFDIDFFKKVNDTYGHHVGDLILKHIVNIAKGSIRLNDIIARYGGEEFAIFLPQTGEKSSVDAAEKIRKIICDTPYILDGKEIKVTASFGVYGFYYSSEEDIGDIMIKADRALYKAKASGRNKVVFYQEDSI